MQSVRRMLQPPGPGPYDPYRLWESPLPDPQPVHGRDDRGLDRSGQDLPVCRQEHLLRAAGGVPVLTVRCGGREGILHRPPDAPRDLPGLRLLAPAHPRQLGEKSGKDHGPASPGHRGRSVDPAL